MISQERRILLEHIFRSKAESKVDKKLSFGLSDICTSDMFLRLRTVMTAPRGWCNVCLRRDVTECFHVTSRRRLWNCTQFLCKGCLLFWLKNMLIDHMSENTLRQRQGRVFHQISTEKCVGKTKRNRVFFFLSNFDVSGYLKIYSFAECLIKLLKALIILILQSKSLPNILS